jgi:hypothetical protein
MLNHAVAVIPFQILNAYAGKGLRGASTPVLGLFGGGFIREFVHQ